MESDELVGKSKMAPEMEGRRTGRVWSSGRWARVGDGWSGSQSCKISAAGSPCEQRGSGGEEGGPGRRGEHWADGGWRVWVWTSENLLVKELCDAAVVEVWWSDETADRGWSG